MLGSQWLIQRAFHGDTVVRMTPIALGTVAGLLEHDHALAAYCPRCCRWLVLPPAGLVAQGTGWLRRPFNVR